MIPNRFVGPVEQLAGRINANAGSVIVILKNGNPHKVLLPGKRITRGFGAPMLGKLEAVQVNTSDVSLGLTLENVLTKSAIDGWLEGYSIPTIEIDLTIQINPNDDFSKLQQHIKQRGSQFAESLIAESTTGLESFVRSELSSWDMSDLRHMSVATVLGSQKTPFSFGSGVLRITSLSAKVPEWPVEYLRRVASVQNETATIAETHSDQAVLSVKAGYEREMALAQEAHEAELNAIKQSHQFTAEIATLHHEILINSKKSVAEHQIQFQQSAHDIEDLGERVKGLAPLAKALDIPLKALIDPDQQSGIIAGAQELLTKMVDPANSRFIRDNPQLFAIALHNAGFDALSRPRISNGGSAQSPAGALSPDHPEPMPSSQFPNAETDSSADEVYTAAIIIDDELSTDARLVRIWKSVYSNNVVESLTAIGSAQDGHQATVMVVLEQPLPEHPPLAKEFRTKVAHLLKVEDVTIMRFSSSDYNGLAQQFIAQTARPSTSKLRVTTRIAADSLGLSAFHIYLGGNTEHARGTRDYLNGTGGTELKALESLLPFSGIIIHVGMPDAGSDES